MSYDAVSIAKYIISYCTDKQCPISNLKLQKMIYFSWIQFYKKEKKYLFNDEICAWQLGPVVPKVYYEFCSYAGIPISRNYSVDIATADRNTLNTIIDNYLPKSASSLVNQTHQPNKPWAIIYNNGYGLRGGIPFSLIIEMECSDED